jgi:hypothetical protein
MAGLAVTLAMMRSMPRFAVCRRPAIATPGSAAAFSASPASDRVQTATLADGSPMT